MGGNVMRNYISGKNRQKGIAMPTVIFFLTFVVILGTAILVVAQSNAQQSAAVYQADRHYYAAESAVQVAIQEFISRFDTGFLRNDDLVNGMVIQRSYRRGEWDTLTPQQQIDAFAEDRTRIENRIRDNVLATYGIVRNRIEDESIYQFNHNEQVRMNNTFEYDIVFTEPPVRRDGYDYSQTNLDDRLRDYVGMVLSQIHLRFTASSGGREVSMEYRIDLVPRNPPPDNTPSGVDFNNLGNGLISDHDKSTGCNAGNTLELYENFIDALNDMMDQVKEMEIDELIPGDMVTGTSTVTGGTLNNAWFTAANFPAGRNRIVSSGNLTLNGIPATNANAQRLEYLEVNGDLTITGTVNLSNLKGVHVTGCVIINGATFTGTSPNGTHFLIEGSTQHANGWTRAALDVVGSVTIDWCHFYVNGGNIFILQPGGGDSFTSNSIFVAAKTPDNKRGMIAIGFNSRPPTTNGNNTIMNASNNQIPQFYAEGDLKLYSHNSGNAVYRGIFATLVGSHKNDNGVGYKPITETEDETILGYEHPDIFYLRGGAHPNRIEGLFVGQAQPTLPKPGAYTPTETNIMDGGIFNVMRGDSLTDTESGGDFANFRSSAPGDNEIYSLRETTGR
jgi:hypothetical protein